MAASLIASNLAARHSFARGFLAVVVALVGLTAAADDSPDLWPRAVQRAAALDDGDAQARQILAGMSLDEKVGQMIQADIASITPAQLKTYKLGSMLAGGGAAPGDNVRTTPQAWLQLTDAFYRA